MPSEVRHTEPVKQIRGKHGVAWGSKWSLPSRGVPLEFGAKGVELFLHVIGTNSSWRQRCSDFFVFWISVSKLQADPAAQNGGGGTCACQWPVFEAPTVAAPAPRPASSRRSWMRRTRHRRRSRRLVGGSLPKTWKTCWRLQSSPSPVSPPPTPTTTVWGGCYIKKRVFRARSLWC